jgi:putative glutathione S-transferase
MGFLINGKWTAQGHDTAASGGRFVRQATSFRNWITPDGRPGPTGGGGFKDGPGVVPDPWGARRIYEVYLRSDSSYTGRASVPVLWDKARNVIVSNESSEIIRMFNAAFDGVGAAPGDYYPAELRDEIDRLNARVYETVNNGVYKAGFATTQEAYEDAVRPLFATLDMLEERLATRRYLCGERLTEADWRLFTTLVRFDPVYVGHFKCNLRRLVDYPNLWAYARELYQHPGVAATTDFTHIKRHYYQSHRTINPSGIVPVGPELDFLAPHGRERLPLPVAASEARSRRAG